MDRVVDLDEAAAALAARTADRRSADLEVGPVTWRDAEASWPRSRATDRACVHDPDSVGVLLHGSGDAELSVVLCRGGWAGVDFVAGLDEAGVLPASGIALGVGLRDPHGSVGRAGLRRARDCL